MFAGGFQRGGKQKDAIPVETRNRFDLHQLRPAFGQRAGLVEDQRIHAFEGFQHGGIAHQYARRGRPAGAGHDRHWGRQAERTGTGDDQDGHRAQYGMAKARFRSPDHPGGKCEDRGQHDRRHEIARDDIGDPLHGRA